MDSLLILEVRHPSKLRHDPRVRYTRRPPPYFKTTEGPQKALLQCLCRTRRQPSSHIAHAYMGFQLRPHPASARRCPLIRRQEVGHRCNTVELPYPFLECHRTDDLCMRPGSAEADGHSLPIPPHREGNFEAAAGSTAESVRAFQAADHCHSAQLNLGYISHAQ